MTDVGETDFRRIAEDLRRASDEARRQAMLNPSESEKLRRKARDLEAAAERIEEDANARQGFVHLNVEA
jgi:hypothetical protein